MSQLNEGLRSLDLENLVKDLFEVDTYKSKMGEDRDVCVVSFRVKDRNPANDLMEFIEKGFSYVLDADVSAGEDSAGDYHVFVELPRTPDLSKQIEEMLYGIDKLTGTEQWRFRYHKEDRVHEASQDNISKIIPSSPGLYDGLMVKIKTESVKSFFNKTLMDDLTLNDNIITIHKPFGQKIRLEWLNEEDPQSILETAPSVDDTATAEIFWMTKVLGDYDISKFGDRFLFTNGDKAILLKRTEL
jgi:hypothetical protein